MEISCILSVLETERECVSRDCDRNCGNCDLVMEADIIMSAYDEAIKIIRKQIPVESVEDPNLIRGGWIGWQTHCCGNCGNNLRLTAKYCDNCGRPIKRSEKKCRNMMSL